MNKAADPAWTLVSIESPYSHWNPLNVKRNVDFAVQCNKHAAHELNCATWAPHLCNTQGVMFGLRVFLGDGLSAVLSVTRLWAKTSSGAVSVGRERTLEVTNKARVKNCDAVVVYTNLGVTSGMQSAVDAATVAGKPVIYRELPPEMMKHVFGQGVASTAVPCATWLVSAAGTATLLQAVYRIARTVVK